MGCADTRRRCMYSYDLSSNPPLVSSRADGNGGDTGRVPFTAFGKDVPQSRADGSMMDYTMIIIQDHHPIRHSEKSNSGNTACSLYTLVSYNAKAYCLMPVPFFGLLSICVRH